MDLAREYLKSVLCENDLISFNPCFSGSCSRICPSLNPSSIPGVVSILVLVDLAREFSEYSNIMFVLV